MTTTSGTTKVADGVEVAWSSHGPDGAPVLLLVHGFTGSAADWAGVVDALVDQGGWRVVTMEHRGHGASTNTGDAATYTFEQLAADLAVLVDDLGLDRFDLLGHSMGGVVSMHYALDHPGRLRSLVLMDTAARADHEHNPNDWFRSGIERIRRTMDLPAMLADFAPALPEDVQARMEAAWSAMDPVAFVELGTALVGSGVPDEDRSPSLASSPARKGRSGPGDDGLLDRLATLDVPTTVVVGEHDTGLRPGSDDLAATIPGATLVVIPGAAHSPQFEHRSAWLDALFAHAGTTR